MEVFEGEDHNHHSSSSATSSIGKDSDTLSETECAHNDNEAQSAYKCNEPLDSMDSLQHLLPIRRGISKFYDGKSKSFTSLVDVDSSPSVKDMSKPENAYSKRRRNLMVFNHTWRKSQNYPLRSKCGGFSKRTINYDNSSCASEDSSSSSNPRLTPLPPIHPTAPPSSPMHHKFSPWHFLSLADIPGK